MNRRVSAVLLTLAAALLAAASASAAPASRALTLRLADLPPGYALPFGPCESNPALADPSRNCVIEFGRLWHPAGAAAGPAVVISAAVVHRTAQAAVAALARPRLVASLAFDPAPDDFDLVEPAPAIGDAAVLLRGHDGSAVVVWRSGRILAALLAGNALQRDAPAVDLQAAIALAAAQQARIASPSPLRVGDNDASEVVLDDPRLDVPVWWLDRVLPQRGALPSLRLLASEPADRASQRIGLGPVLLYGRRHARADVIVQLARRSVLQRPAIRGELRRLRRDPCSRTDRLSLADGRATIFVRDRRCPSLNLEDTPDALTDASTVAILRGVVVFLSADDCTNCHGPVSRYESAAGMRRIVRALRPREPSSSVVP